MSSEYQLTEAVREACLRAALDAYESAGISGLCAEGRWELAIQAIRIVDLQQVAGEVLRDGE
ncbi:MAG: acetyltransferase [Gammaproteobacteria bacterium]|nr:acetyltransferase [Gammaproteobacteria bacterium]